MKTNFHQPLNTVDGHMPTDGGSGTRRVPTDGGSGTRRMAGESNTVGR